MIRYIPWACIAVLYSPILYQLYSARWDSIDYTHAYFILPVTLWLIWRKRKDIKVLPPTPAESQKALITLVIGLAMFALGWRKDYLFVSTLSLIPVSFGLIAYLYGPKAAGALRFPLLYLLLMVPPPLGILDAITLPLRYFTSTMAYILLKSFFFSVTKDGLILSVEGQQIYLEPACSGFRSLITLFSLGLLYAYLTKGSFKKKMILLASIIPLALFGNLIRVVIICLLAYYFGEDVAQGFFHSFSGFVVFIIALLGLTAIEGFLHSRDTAHE
jgi:exosortase